MNILVIGGSGYLGSRLIPYLSQWHTVTNYDLTQGEDVRNTVLLKSAVQKYFFDAVIYLASVSNNDMCERSPELSESINERAFVSVGEALKGVPRFIYASSVAAYGDQDNATEDCELKPTTLYGEGKAYCEKSLQQSDLPFVITRCASICGYSPRMRYDLMVNKMTQNGFRTGRISVHGGSQVRSHIHINDVCRLYRFLLNAKGVERQAFNAVSENMSVMDTAVTVSRIIKNTSIDVLSPTDNRSYSVSGEKAREVLGFKPLYSVKDAIVELYLNCLYA